MRDNTRTIRSFGVAFVILSLVMSAELAQAEDLIIGAAPSLKAAFQKIIPMFQTEYGTTVRVVYGPSQTLRRQIEKGAAIDVFLPAAVEELDKLHLKGMILNGGPRIYARTSLVLVMSGTSLAMPVSFRDALANREARIAVGDPQTSALGEITAQALKRFDPMHRNRLHLLQAQHGEDIANLIHSGEAELGVVYRVDAFNSGRLRIIDETPAGTYSTVRLGGAVVSTCRNTSRHVAEEFVDFMASPRIQKLLLQYGFDPGTHVDEEHSWVEEHS